jgi:hypothetical protein
MRNLLALLAAAVLVTAGVGWYLNWFHVQSVAEPFGHRSVNIDINSPKIKEDLKAGEAKVQEALNKEQHKDANPLNKAAEDAKNAGSQIQQGVKDQIGTTIDDQANKLKSELNTDFSHP